MRFADYPKQIHLDALAGIAAELPMDYDSLAARAAAALPVWLYEHIAGGAGDESTQRRNVAAFAEWGLLPRVLAGASEPDVSVDLWGRRYRSPIFLAPIGVAGLAAADGHGDFAVAQAAADTGVPAMFPTMMQDPLEEVIVRAGKTPSFFQLYAPRDRELAASLIARAERAGYGAIAVTVDTPVPGWRPADLAAGAFPQLRGQALRNYTTDPVFCGLVDCCDRAAVVAKWLATFSNPLSWSDLEWIRSLTDLPLIVKGVAHPEDVQRAIDYGADGVYCSNHGGRQANTGLSALETLPAVVAAAGGRVPVLFDSGVRSGADVVKALGLGATMVGVGRPYVYGLALAGARGVAHVLRMIMAEAELLMAVAGCPDIAAIQANLRRVPALRS